MDGIETFLWLGVGTSGIIFTLGTICLRLTGTVMKKSGSYRKMPGSVKMLFFFMEQRCTILRTDEDLRNDLFVAC